ncbi:helix-turn-helix transcriptional regulator [Chloroflexota bacterium]
MIENRLKEYRESRGLSQVELSRLARIAAPNLSAIERGRLLPWPKMKKRLAKALRVTEQELFPED